MKKKYLYLAGAIVVIVILIAALCLSGQPTGAPADVPTEIPTEAPGLVADVPDTVPVVELEGDCLKDYTNWNDKSTYYPATLTFTNGDTSFTREIEIKPQGTSSLFAPKKNFTVKFAEGITFLDKWGQQTKYVLKADYIDPTCSGNVVSAKLAAEMNEKYGVLPDTPNNGVIDGFPIFVKINGEDAGIFNLTIPKDAWLFGMDEENPNHLVLACEGWSPASRMQSADIDYEADWSFEVGEANDVNKAAFERLVTFVSTADDATFVRDFDQYLDLDACLNYICYINAGYALDNVAKNMLMVTYDGKVWYPMLYDLDSLWGIGYDGTALAEPSGTWSGTPLADGNCLLYRVSYFFRDQLQQRYQELRSGILSQEHILEAFRSYTARIPQEYYDINNALWYADGTHIRSLELMDQLMAEYLPIVDASLMNAAGASATLPPAAAQSVALGNSLVHYVWETDGVQQSLEDLEALPVTATVSYKLDGSAISPQELAGKSGALELTLRVERKTNAAESYGVAATVQLDTACCSNISMTGGTLTQAPEKTAAVAVGSGWLNGGNSAYEMQLRMDVTDFVPAKYVVAVNAVHLDEDGGDNSLEALLAVASELTAIIDDGVKLHTSLTEWHTFLTNVQTTLEGTGALTQTLVSPEAGDQDSAESIMQELLTAAEAEADALLQTLGQAAANRTTQERIQLLDQAAGDQAHTEEQKAQASRLAALLESYAAVADRLNADRQAAEQINEALQSVNGTLPDLVGAYSYANDTFYGLVYRISTLYQNIASYYGSIGGDGYDGGAVDWRDAIIFTNRDINDP